MVVHFIEEKDVDIVFAHDLFKVGGENKKDYKSKKKVAIL